MRLDTLLAGAGLPPSTGVTELGGGTFNTVLQVTTSAGDVVVKLAPDPDRPVLSYEHGIMATEAQYYRLAAERGISSVPRLLHHAPGEALVLSVCPGRPWPSVTDRLDAAARHALRAAVGREVAALHQITGPGFGYPARPLHATWRAAFTGMLDDLLRDADRFGVALPLGARELAARVARASPVLDDVVTPVLVHFDLWDGNILVDLPPDGPPQLGGLIDAERAFWGDPLAEFVSLRLLGDLELDPGLLAGYGQLALDASARLRLALYRLYLYLIMWVETVPRGSSPARVAWLRTAVLEPAAAILDAL